jgi:hypothetical protein
VEYESDVLSLLIQQEVALGRLYDFFAATPGTGEAPWHFLAYDEERHARALASLRSVPGAVEWLGVSGIRPSSVRCSIEYVDSQRVRAETRGVTAVQAVAIALDFETALIERQFSQAGVPESFALRRVLESLASETEKHRKALMKALEAERQEPGTSEWCKAASFYGRRTARIPVILV